VGQESPKVNKVTASERSASQINRVTQRLWRGVEGPRRYSIYPCRSKPLNHEALQQNLLRYPPDGPEYIFSSTVIIFDLKVKSHHNKQGVSKQKHLCSIPCSRLTNEVLPVDGR
jgi:hypothetical protein